MAKINQLDRYGRAMQEIIRDRSEFPELVASIKELTLYRFDDTTEVIETNAGVVVEGDDGFDEVRQEILNKQD